jgi:ATP-binding cassette subfamily F protein 3
MIKAILGEIKVEGTCQLGHNAQIGYFAQNQAALLDPNLTVFQTVDEVARGHTHTIKKYVGPVHVLWRYDSEKVSLLSGGEKTRLAMVKLLLEPVNVLILDEPTNHLDIKSKDVLKRSPQEF